MNKTDINQVKKVVEQIQISSKMQEEIIMNIQNKMENKKVWNWKKMTTVAAAFVMMVGVISFPVQAVVKNVVKVRMENVSQEELLHIYDMIQEQEIPADGFSREYSSKEKERNKELWESYKNGTFPQKIIQQVDNVEEVVKGTLCYVKNTGYFYLPDREMTDEEILEIIDFQNTMNYALLQNTASQEAKEEYLAEKARLEEMVQAANGISEEEAIKIAEKYMKHELGEKAKEKELMVDVNGCGAFLEDISNETSYEHKGNVAYNVGFGNPNDHSTYTCLIDATDGSVLNAIQYEVESH